MSSPAVVIVVQARMSSRRLPGKVLRPLAGAPAIVRMMQRVARVTSVGDRILAASEDASDDPLVAVCREHDIPVVRGPLEDVLHRFVLAAPPEYPGVVRLTGDCPLVDPALVDRHIELFVSGWPRFGYVTNTVERTHPDGLDVEVVSRELLVEADRRATRADDREHVLPWVRRRAETLSVTQKVDLSRLRWTLDTLADYEVLSAIYDELLPLDSRFDSSDVYKLLVRRPELIRIEGHESLGPEERSFWVARIEAHLAGDGADE